MLQILVSLLEEAAGKRPKTELLERFTTDKIIPLQKEADCISFSGGVADLINASKQDWLAYGDLGVLLGEAIRTSKLCAGSYRIGSETLRATVIGAGIHTTELSGSTVFYSHIQFPVQNCPVAEIGADELFAGALQRQMELYDQMPVLSLKATISSYDDLSNLADKIAAVFLNRSETPILMVESDYAKALGHAVSRRLGPERPLLCLDGLQVPEGSYLDIQAPVGEGSAVPVIIKTLAFQ